jgi:hypothetical protein
VEKRLEHAVSGLDAGALLGGLAQGQANSKGESDKANAGDIANQIAGGGSPGLSQIIGGLNKQNEGGAKNQSITQEQGQAKEKGEPKEQEQGNGQAGGKDGLAIQVEKTTLLEANGQQVKTEIIKEVGTQSAAAAPAEERPTPPPAPMPEMSPETKSSATPVEVVATVCTTHVFTEYLS